MVILLDLVVLAPFIQPSYAMLASMLGSWSPFALNFAVRYLVGLYAAQRDRSGRALRKAASHATM